MFMKKKDQNILFLSLGLITTGFALLSRLLLKNNTDPLLEKAVKMSTAKWKAALELSEDQERLMFNNSFRFAEKKHQVLESSGSDARKVKKLKKLQTLENIGVKNILNDEQYSHYLKLLEERSKPREGLQQV